MSDDGQIIDALVGSAIELGIDPDRTSALLYDVLDVEALVTLVNEDDESQTNAHLQISFNIWGIHFLVTSREVIATQLS
ncbi:MULTISPECIES: HalOD1 output domain-containing protein [Haloferax]|uniref:Halobacterial output domain-containing protein n=2 Tax=Haloferax TaxID=2251 RepID=A0A6G1Z5V6_9EURY|nr:MULTISPECIES: HalOD1 output domain-containing protein [Haloferax]KAB1185376.1 hypothetical protein Hfx1149_15070 [Haloferax sp. CBA1149]MRW82017.1 hypothetical protein [Haloferax marinisediminis]